MSGRSRPGDCGQVDMREMVLRLAHEIRNPLASIKSGVQLVEHIVQPEGELAVVLADMHGEIARINNVIQDMQRFVRLDVHTAVSVAVSEAAAVATEAVAELKKGKTFEALTADDVKAFIAEARKAGKRSTRNVAGGGRVAIRDGKRQAAFDTYAEDAAAAPVHQSILAK